MALHEKRREHPNDQEVYHYAMLISVIIPSHNKFPQNLLTLFSLEQQTVPPNQYEVILIDDASSDSTSDIPHNWSFPYRLRLLKLPVNAGRPAARNAGIRIAEGEIVIFLDAEVLVEPGFLESHLSLHQQDSRLLASGVLTMKGVYTQLDPGFNAGQLNEAYRLLSQQPSLHSFWNDFIATGKPQQLFGREEIHRGAFRTLAVQKPFEAHYEEEILQLHGDRLLGFHLPWLISHTGNLSVARTVFQQFGLFEEYSGYGWDDLELGYRLHLQGFRFAHIRHPYVYHQEHPVYPSVNIEAQTNFFLFQQKYRQISLLVLLLCYIPNPMRIHHVHLVLDEVYRLDAESSGIYLPLIGTFRSMLEAAGYLLRFNQPVSNLLTHAGCPPGSPGREHFEAQRSALAVSGRWSMLREALHRLIVL
ncbi:glycosyltransferase [Paenibacillus pasadenensis]|uniref:glycosyltransferase n=1 Tax=Paenibacillus pasadenensis TaxID=217090 RepID=UPI00203C282E|nr:glycosyltransferase [Paenibacillus pasadenensis]MCM3747709.1 glycosyltransferase [Paenibacillus pasadenensis]